MKKISYYYNKLKNEITTSVDLGFTKTEIGDARHTPLFYYNYKDWQYPLLKKYKFKKDKKKRILFSLTKSKK